MGGPNFKSSWHVHPKGTAFDRQTNVRGFVQEPSDDDKKLAKKYGGINIVVGARDNKVYFYDGKGTVAVMGIADFLNTKYHPQ
jgi:hypothetical protein